MSAYGLLSAGERKAIAWVREHGGLSHVKDILHDLRAVVERLGLEWSESELHGLMAALDRRLMPEGCEWPRYESGELVMLGDTVTKYVGGGTIKVRSVEFLENMTCLHERFKTDQIAIVRPGERVKRPAVLAADGEPLEVGQTVWHVATGREYTVRSCTNGGAHLSGDGKPAGYCRADYLTHQRPVLDADGVPIKVGDTVWMVDDPDGPYRVTEVTTKYATHVHGYSDEFGDLDMSPSQLTHQRPVLDADGNRIEPAMDVWWVCDGDERGVHAEKLHVESIGEDGLVTCDPYNGGTWVELDSSELHVRKPVLDADGVPIREGDTVYLLPGEWCDEFPCQGFHGGEELEVFADGEARHVPGGVQCREKEKRFGFRGTCYPQPLQLTHTKPEIDTWERIEEDASLSANDYRERYGMEKRDGMTWPQQIRKDLVRRCRALAERERGE